MSSFIYTYSVHASVSVVLLLSCWPVLGRRLHFILSSSSAKYSTMQCPSEKFSFVYAWNAWCNLLSPSKYTHSHRQQSSLIETLGLFAVIREKLLSAAQPVTMAMFNTLFEVIYSVLNFKQ